MSDFDFEIEIQVRVEGLDSLLAYLDESAKFTGEKYQKDEYFSPVHRNFIETEPVKEWLRVRESKNNSITYKLWHYDENGRSNYCDEYETSIGEPAQLRKIFTALDLKPVITVEKKRRSWVCQDYEIVVDEVTDLGTFVEVEYKGEAGVGSADNIVSEMVSFLRKAGCTKIERNYVGYPFMILYPERQEFEEL